LVEASESPIRKWYLGGKGRWRDGKGWEWIGVIGRGWGEEWDWRGVEDEEGTRDQIGLSVWGWMGMVGMGLKRG
jgi:hypothetical protein